jgi:hypothetical protein
MGIIEVLEADLTFLSICIERVSSSVKRRRIINDPCKLRAILAQDLVMGIACAFHNFRLFISPGSPLIEQE